MFNHTHTQTRKVSNNTFFTTYFLPSPLLPLPLSLSLSLPSFPLSLSLPPSSLFLSLSLSLSLSPYLTITLQGVGGAVQLPKGFLRKAFEAVREKGGLCISDEVSEEEDHTHWAQQGKLFVYILTYCVYNW